MKWMEKRPESNLVDLEFFKHAARANKGKIWLVTKGTVNVRGLQDVTSPDQPRSGVLVEFLPGSTRPFGWAARSDPRETRRIP